MLDKFEILDYNIAKLSQHMKNKRAESDAKKRLTSEKLMAYNVRA